MSDQPVSKTPAPDDEQMVLFRDWLDTQKEEHDLRRQELDLQSKSQDQNHAWALKALAAQQDDRKSIRQYNLSRQKLVHLSVVLIIAMLVIFSGYAVHLGQSAIVIEIIKLGGVALGGYGIGAYRATRTIKREGNATIPPPESGDP